LKDVVLRASGGLGLAASAEIDYSRRAMTYASAHRLSVAPMMDWTDRRCRAFHRALTSRTLLYTEMVTAQAVAHGDIEHLLGFDAVEHPVALQLGGSDPALLADAARIGGELGYDEINLNVGCPSDRVQSGRFGACLMLEPQLVAECVAAMAQATAAPVTVKCRIGVDDQDPEVALFGLVEACAATGVKTFAVHARKAWLQGLSPKENRDIPPLDYDIVYRLKRERPDLTIVLNGGVANLDEAQRHLAHVDGVMLGRTAGS
jgi:tRNA-dihydrouridine synthase A